MLAHALCYLPTLPPRCVLNQSEPFMWTLMGRVPPSVVQCAVRRTDRVLGLPLIHYFVCRLLFPFCESKMCPLQETQEVQKSQMTTQHNGSDTIPLTTLTCWDTSFWISFLAYLSLAPDGLYILFSLSSSKFSKDGVDSLVIDVKNEWVLCAPG